jgi:hypothetical protein
MKQAYQLRTKHKSKLLFAMMNALVGENASISFEGRLSIASFRFQLDTNGGFWVRLTYSGVHRICDLWL